MARFRPSTTRVAAAVDVVELRLGHRVVDVDRGEEERARPSPSGRGGGRPSSSPRRRRGSPRRVREQRLPVLRELRAEQLEDDAPLLGVVLRVERGDLARPSRTRAPLWTSSVASPPSSTISVGPLAVGPVERLVGAPPVLLERLALPGEDRRALRVLGRPAVLGRPTATAAAAWSWVEKMLHETQRTSAPRSTSVSIRTAVWMVMCRLPMIALAGERLLGAVAVAQRHQPGHLLLGEADLLAAELGEGEVARP